MPKNGPLFINSVKNGKTGSFGKEIPQRPAAPGPGQVAEATACRRAVKTLGRWCITRKHLQGSESRKCPVEPLTRSCSASTKHLNSLFLRTDGIIVTALAGEIVSEYA